MAGGQRGVAVSAALDDKGGCPMAVKPLNNVILFIVNFCATTMLRNRRNPQQQKSQPKLRR